ncbi:MAG: MmcQ/YjbR family DNA-binding protein [Anaerolineae bacterium]|nr:MmcQ/YjbR family DNA-binding protein [Anaerolineae bacterium]
MLTAQQLRDYCLAKRGTEETYPFGDDPVYKVMGKMFALVARDENPVRITLKCNPTLGQLQREKYPAVKPGYYMNKLHWNTVTVDGTIPDDELREMIDDSYALVVKGLKKAEREALEK